MNHRIIIQFSKQDNSEAYNAYRRIKYEVFVIEQGWHSLADPEGRALAAEDPFDALGRYQLALSSEGQPVGVVRGVPLKEGFPHQKLFAHHLSVGTFAQALPLLSSINALAVLPAYRRGQYRVAGTNREGSVGSLLLLSLFETLGNEGIEGVIATAGGRASLRFFTRFGFQVIDQSTPTALHTLPMTNIGLVFGSPAHLHTERRCRFESNLSYQPSTAMQALANYFAKRQLYVSRLENLHSVSGAHDNMRDKDTATV